MAEVNSYARYAGANYPEEWDVRENVLYGDQVNQLIGTLELSGEEGIFPNPRDVRESINYGTVEDPFRYVGVLHVPPEERVEQGYKFDANRELTGSLIVGCETSGPLVEKDIFLTRGDSYTGGNAIVFPEEQDWPDLTGATFKYGHNSGDFETPGTKIEKGISVTLTKEQTAAMRGVNRYDLQATLSDGSVFTLYVGDTHVAETETDVPENDPMIPLWPG